MCVKGLRVYAAIPHLRDTALASRATFAVTDDQPNQPPGNKNSEPHDLPNKKLTIIFNERFYGTKKVQNGKQRKRENLGLSNKYKLNLR